VIRRLLRRGAVAAVGIGVVLLAAPTPAGAHGVGGLQPTNYDTIVRGVTPARPGLEARAVDLGQRIELRNDSGTTVVVVGYSREPYLRIGPGGVWENQRSPAVFLNRSVRPTQAAPATYDATAPPEWHRVSDTPVARWHDHRAHWMDPTDPPAVQQSPGRRHVVIPDWKIPLRIDDRTLAIEGDVVWVPGPSPWPWIALAVGVGAVLVALSRTRRWADAIAAALAVLVVSETAHVIGAWAASDESIGTRLGASIYSIGGIALSILALVWVRRRDPWAAMPAVLIAGLFMLVAGGLADLTTLTRSQVPSTLTPGLARLTVALALGLGSGLVIAAAWRLRGTGPAREPSRA
jgi:hypothetical protein